MSFAKLVFSAFIAITLFAQPALADKISVEMDEVNHALSMRRNMGGYIRLSGILTDLLRVQKVEYGKRHGGNSNKAAAEAEDLLNEAGLFASQDDFDGSFKVLKKAAKVILGAIEKINSE